MSPVEQIALAVNIALRRDAATLLSGQSAAGAKATESRAIPGLKTKREHFLDRLRRSWHSQLQWENGAGGDEAVASRSGFPNLSCLPPRLAPNGRLRSRLPEPACPLLISSCRS